ncbi:hypothetical protein P1X14_10745 [Sphingomonas sp. AOB5]|uniref:hypothetical protein n=1 Tax=Sphingomonas sp. AOB5 TaxID=3034017 RepID=UPI0023F8D5BE|nr:hypothetical protein [Sphingomonas sp. AOB5]MDF7775724.1 hypothetical protein [Sphingomonas sp. AOB5]
MILLAALALAQTAPCPVPSHWRRISATEAVQSGATRVDIVRDGALWNGAWLGEARLRDYSHRMLKDYADMQLVRDHSAPLIVLNVRNLSCGTVRRYADMIDKAGGCIPTYCAIASLPPRQTSRRR